MDLHGKTWSVIVHIMNTSEQLKQRLSDVIGRQQALLSEFNSALNAGDNNRQSDIESELRKLSTEQQRLTTELRYSQLGRVAAPRVRLRETGKTGRELILDALDEIGAPVSPSTISEFSQATTGIGIPATRFASLRRDDERAARRDISSRPAWLVPALSTARLNALPRLITSSAWDFERRLVGARSTRVNHLRITLAFLNRYERQQHVSSTQNPALEHLVLRYARGIPGASATGLALDPDRIRKAANVELEAIESEDLRERKDAAIRLAKYGDLQKLFGLPALIDGNAKGA